MIKSKKAVSESTSFILLTLIVVLFSSVAYFYLNGELKENVAKIDRNSMELNLKKFDFVTRNIMSFDNSTISYPISYKTGALIFQGNQLIYQSVVEYSDTNINCFSEICYLWI